MTNDKCKKFVEKIQNFIIKNTDLLLIQNDYFLNKTCFNAISELSNVKNTNNFFRLFQMIGNSGKNLQDFGLEDSCEKQGFKYYFLSFNVSDTIFNDKRYISLR